MGKFLLSALSSILIVLVLSTSYAGSKVDPYIKASSTGSSSMGAKAASLNSSINISESSEMRSIFIKTANAEAVKEIVKSNGGMVHTVAGNIMTASVSMASIDIIAESDEVEFIEGGKPIDLSNDMGSLETNTPEVHKGTNLPASYTGAGTIIGIIDTGIDFAHPDFYDAEGRSRIISIWNQTRSSGPYPMEIDDSYGTECNSDSIVDGSCPLYDANGHGTHVAGTAAGSDEKYRGVAPDANIIVVSYDSSVSLDSGYAEPIFSTKICQAAYYVFSKASQLGMPAVINLSLGTHIGAHDGTSLFEECLSELIQDSAGRAIVAAAGNEYYTEGKYTGIHAGADVNGSVAANFEIKKVTNDRIYYLDVWGSPGSDLSVGLAIHDGDPSGTAVKYSGDIAMGDQSSGEFLGGAIEYSINFSESSSVLNGKPHAGIRIRLNSSFTDVDGYSFDLVLSGSGSFDAWLFPDKDRETSKPILFTDQSGPSSNGWNHIPGDSLKTIAIPATSPNIIAVGAYTTRNKWEQGPGCCEVAFDIDQLLDFSSAGPTPSPEFTGI
ncbi:MAG: S8 family serine peptidase, partial [Deltaproteobacteria bacterium]|nr:S8 family serine peptidase [Deltaproteobacteria bacterium]